MTQGGPLTAPRWGNATSRQFAGLMQRGSNEPAGEAEPATFEFPQEWCDGLYQPSTFSIEQQAHDANERQLQPFGILPAKPFVDDYQAWSRVLRRQRQRAGLARI